ncbi:TPA: helix-turn-helix transcriptional regulator [Clostridium botulinum]|uniref:PadR family transcriptional regulator n=1 Tax=Clostridium TaxID=1485 RepID=UPI0007731364|nr:MULTISPECIES: PadR family transcriptional regulator [Clostridium]AUM95545.1 PadR family transcriptional regulator [Clostridium sporogenes]AVQ45493.1 PadR family transcriptional regulator [Clostridium botulinum]AVQ49328.1 PadR family transcriptional regulator [Clostridium botulinum]AVQ52988.1 PadR family transcriptional regulator [Clostridium botulinum]EKO1911608.1 helix-turn-helix transcriptional regulator [Clostridium botulinum]
MQEQIIRKLFLGFIHIHILHHAKKEPFYGSWMIEELKKHGYEISAGTLYPILHNLQKNGALKVEDKNVDGKIRKYYSITQLGENLLNEAKEKAYELFKEIKE